MDISTLENWLWEAACSIRGPLDAPKYKDYILPLLFYNTSAPGLILVINKAKAHPGEILLINASKLCAKGRPKNYLTPDHIRQIFDLYHHWQASLEMTFKRASA